MIIDVNLDKIKDDINEMQKMVSDYLDYSTSQSELSSNKFNLSVMLNEIMHKLPQVPLARKSTNMKDIILKMSQK